MQLQEPPGTWASLGLGSVLTIPVEGQLGLGHPGASVSLGFCRHGGASAVGFVVRGGSAVRFDPKGGSAVRLSSGV